MSGASKPTISPLVHVAARRYGRRQKCRVCGYVLHDWSAEQIAHNVYWKPGTGVVVEFVGRERRSWRVQNCPESVKARAVFCAK